MVTINATLTTLYLPIQGFSGPEVGKYGNLTEARQSPTVTQLAPYIRTVNAAIPAVFSIAAIGTRRLYSSDCCKRRLRSAAVPILSATDRFSTSPTCAVRRSARYGCGWFEAAKRRSALGQCLNKLNSGGN